jgi:hypothetical protein
MPGSGFAGVCENGQRLESYRVQPKKGAKSFVIASASTTCRLVDFSATFGYSLLGILRLSVSLIWKIIPIVK